ncbi:uncharacterized protein An12g01420 [Aspergillus niger]|uniref:Contig An12c0060, genomic contig n=2 Tax=Aspergillus niger TaxID=5061 RepID=A2QYJ0_ASPNC|nr:uncharacterized protein An12g01420 [Aspergillus niger]CAK48425.1 unnamed protein product [Aspergillus niger]
MVVRYRQTLFALSKQGGLLKTELPKIATTDSMQGKESKVSIYDWIVTSANLFADMGLTIDSNRGNVGMSRMTEVMNVVTCNCPTEEEVFQGIEPAGRIKNCVKKAEVTEEVAWLHTYALPIAVLYTR